MRHGTRTFLAPALLLAALGLAACETEEYGKENMTSEQLSRDAASCRSQVSAIMTRDRDIDTDIGATVGSDRVRYGRGQLQSDMDTRSNTNRESRLMDACMQARGYTPVNRGPFD